MIDLTFVLALAKAKDALVDASKGEGPNAPRTFAFELVGKCSTFTKLMQDGRGLSVASLPVNLFGFAVCCNATCAAGVPPDVVRLLERRTSRFVDINVS